MIQLFLRDVGLSVRSGGGFGLALIFFLIVVTLIPFALGPDQSALAVIAPGVLWLGALLACLLSLDRIFGLDFEDGTLDLLATSPLPLEAVYVAKASAHWLTTGLIGAFGASLTLGVKRGGLLLSLLVLPLYVPSLIFGSQAVRLVGQGLEFDVALIFLSAISLGAAAILPFASGAALRINLR